MNRTVKSYGRGLSLHDLRRLALGEQIIKWCDEVEPGLHEEWKAVHQQSSRYMAELRADMDRLVLMPTDTPEERADRDRAMGLAQERLERQSAIIERQTRTYLQLSAGGGAAVYAMLSKATRKQEPADREERPVKPFRKFGDVHKLQGQSAQPVEAEVVEAEGAE